MQSSVTATSWYNSSEPFPSAYLHSFCSWCSLQSRLRSEYESVKKKKNAELDISEHGQEAYTS